MTKGCITDNLPAPEFDIHPFMFSVCFHIRNNEATLATNIKNNIGLNVDIKDGLNIGLNDGLNVNINKTQQKILVLMIEKPKITATEISESLGITKRHVESNIGQLKVLNLVKRIGARKNGKWVVKCPKNILTTKILNEKNIN